MDLARVSDFSVLLVGDAIVDEYVYVDVIGKAVKDAALSSTILRREQFKGGVWAAARHVQGFCRRVDVLRGADIMHNSRMVDAVYLRKLFTTHELLPNDDDSHEYTIGDYDCVIVTDFGHGAMTDRLRERVMREARYLCVNTQTNAVNYGFNTIERYPHADYVVLDELEARLAARMRAAPIEDVILKLGRKHIVVTQGKNGACGFDGVFERAPAVAGAVTDTLGAGDAFLAVSSPYAAAGFSLRDLLRIGNAAGAAKVAIVGHSASVDRAALEKYLG